MKAEVRERIHNSIPVSMMREAQGPLRSASKKIAYGLTGHPRSLGPIFGEKTRTDESEVSLENPCAVLSMINAHVIDTQGIPKASMGDTAQLWHSLRDELQSFVVGDEGTVSDYVLFDKEGKNHVVFYQVGEELKPLIISESTCSQDQLRLQMESDTPGVSVSGS